MLPTLMKSGLGTGRRLPAQIMPVVAAFVLGGCATLQPQHPWEQRLRGDAIMLLGEVHDNPEHHRQRLEVLRRAFASGWRPAIAMEQFDRERQADIDDARRDRPRDAKHVIDRASPRSGARGGNWNWEHYWPFIELALEHGVPLVAANLSNADAGRIAKGGYAAVFDMQTLNRLGLDKPVPGEIQAAQEREIDDGHCNALPPAALPSMARAQFARDAVMAAGISAYGERGVVLIAGNGHVRRDIGVPVWLDSRLSIRTFAVGYLEEGAALPPESAFDAVVRTIPAQRTDACVEFRLRRKPS